jgi:hypothetical protein
MTQERTAANQKHLSTFYPPLQSHTLSIDLTAEPPKTDLLGTIAGKGNAAGALNWRSKGFRKRIRSVKIILRPTYGSSTVGILGPVRSSTR